MTAAAPPCALLMILVLAPLSAHPPQVSGSGPHAVVEGDELRVSFEAAGGTGAGFTWRVVGGLPVGLVLDWDRDCVSWGSLDESGAVDGSLASPQLRAVSGLVASRRQPGILWLHDDADSGLPYVYAVDESGRHLHTFELAGAHQDWEDAALGPGPGGGECLHVGDFGDNGRTRSHAWLLRFPEPTVAGGGDTTRVDVETLYFKYPDGKRDIETLFFDWQTGTPYVIERNDGGCRVYKFPLPLDPARAESDPVELILVTRGALLPPTLTAGDSQRDGSRIAVRSYTHIYEYARPPDGAFDDIFAGEPCWTTSTPTQQYEGLTYGPRGDTLLTTTERAGRGHAPLLVSRARPEASTAILSGATLARGSHSITVEVRDSSGEVARTTWALEVLPREEPPPLSLPGDCTSSGELDIGDVTCLLELLFTQSERPSSCDNPDDERLLLDFNGDASADIADAVALLLFLFAGGSGHALGAECVALIGCRGGC